nr:FeoA family protein [uncultured Desulfobulbus sp.]
MRPYHCCTEQHSQRPLFPLAMSGEGERVTLVLIPKGIKIHERLLSMGIAMEDTVTVVQKQPGGAVVISKDGSRYALGGGMAMKILVVKA